ncbi:MAG: AbrB/MazE/SpoVT family DNA-binding domain-containing protein [Desulfarculus sp.]|nr:AbrB/MazE/SpoVT family DNA-binding domain-containing protein [Desulfarculus sp.]
MKKLATVRDRYQITIPEELRDRFPVGGQVEVLPTPDGGAILRPMKVVPATRTQYSPGDMAKLAQLAEEARQGLNLVGPYSNVEDLIRELHGNAKAEKDSD